MKGTAEMGRVCVVESAIRMLSRTGTLRCCIMSPVSAFIDFNNIGNTPASDGMKRSIGRLLTDPSFATQIQQNPEASLGMQNLQPHEKAVLSKIDFSSLQRMQISTTADHTLHIHIPYRQ